MTFKTQMKRMEAFKAPRQGGREEEKDLRVECAGMRLLRRVEAVNWQKTVLEKKMNNVVERLTKKLDMTVALQ